MKAFSYRKITVLKVKLGDINMLKGLILHLQLDALSDVYRPFRGIFIEEDPSYYFDYWSRR